MPGDIGRIPIISLSGCKYLTDILSELPIPQSTYVSIGSRTLLHEPKLVHDAYRCINGEDEKLVDCLASALRHICTDNIIFRDKISELSADNPRIPTLYKAIIKKNEVLSSRQTKPKEDPDVVSRGCTSAGHSEKHLPPEALDVSGGSCTKADREELDSSNDPHPDTRPAPKPVYSAIPVAPLKIALKKTVCDAQSHKKADKHKKHKKCKAVPSQPTTLLLESPEKTCISSPKVELSDSSQKLEKVIELNPVSLPEKSAEPSEKDSLRNTPVFPANSLPPLLPSSDVSLLPSVSSQVSTCPPSSCTVSVSETMVSEHVPAAPPDEPAQLPVVQSPHLVTDSSSEPLPCISTLSIASTTSQTPATTVSNPVTPVNDTSVVSSRRIPDPALSQLFHSAALFHAYQPHCETHKQGESTGGGLFDDWLNNSVKSSDPSGLGSTSVPLSTDCAYSGSASGPSSVVGLTSNISQAPHSVGAILDASGFPSRSPQSVPSSHSSYPATPGGAVVIIPSQTLSSFTTVVASPSGISRCVHAPSAVPSPSARLFDNIESRTETQESISADDQAHAAPHGLAAYLPRSNSLRSNFASVHDVMSEQGVSACSKDLSAVSPNSSTVPCTYSPGSHSQSQSDPNIRPGSTIKPGNKHTNMHGTHSYEPHESKSPRGKLRGRGGRFTAGKGRGGGRRRRTELEDLKMWSMNDSCNAPSDRKLGDAAECFPPSSLKVPSSGSPSLKRSSEARTNGEDVDECANKPFTGLIDEVGSDHGGFTEALVERVKRRHQQREMEPRTSQPYQRCPSTHRSSDASPASSVSPMRSKTAQVSERADGFTNHRVLHERAHKKHNTEAHLKSKVQDASLSASSDKNVDRFKCSDSDSSLSPISTAASSVRSSKLDDSLSSCPNSAAPLAPAPETKVGNELCSSMDSLSPSNLSPDHAHLRSSDDHSKSRVDEGGNTNRSHTLHSSPTLFNSSSTQKNRSSVSGILDEVPNSAYGDAQFDNWDAQSSKNEDSTKKIRRRRRITIHDEDAEDSSTKDKNLGNRFGSLLPPRLEEVRTDPGVLSTKPAEYASNSPLPPTLLPLTSVSSDRWERHKKPLHSPVSSHSRIDTLWEKQSESDVSRTQMMTEYSDMASDVRQKSDHTSVNRAVQEELDRLKGSECTNWSQSRSSSHKTLPGLGQASTSISESQGHYDESTKVTSNTLVSMANNETNFKATDAKGTSKPQPIDSAHMGEGEICADEQPVSSVSTSSPQPLSTYDESFAPDEGGNTPSTIAYTHSSAMDDEDEDLESEEDRSASKKVRKHKNVTEFKLDNSGHSSEYSSYSTSDEPASVENSSFCSPRSRLSSPSSLSAHSERGDLCSATESSDLDGQENEDGTSILSQFTTHLGKILRRVEELDLLKLASPTTTGEHKRHKSDHVAESSDSACIPEAARLSRHELSVLYTESAKVRLNGSMFTIPTGRLVRFLTLLLVNMQEGAHTSPSPVSTTEAIQYLERRLRLHSHRQGGSSRRPHASQLTESVLWCNSKWASVLTGLDCARIALNIIVGPDMPRPLLMEDLIDGIVAVVRRQLDNIICKPFVINASRSSGNASNCGLSAQQLENFTAECVGFRISQIVAVLNSLIRFQPNRFTDNLVIHLTGLGLAIPLYSLSTGQSIERDIKRFSTPIFQQLLSGPFSSREHGATNSPYPLHVGPSIFWLAVWPSHLQRASLGLLAAIYSQYEAHRKLILDEIFSNIVAHCAPTSSTSSKSNDGTRHSPPIGNGSRYSTRTFSLLSSKWFFEENTLRKHAAMNHRKLDDSDECVDCDSGAKRAPRSVGVHALSALFLSLVQGLVQIPSSFSNSSSSGGSGTNSRKGNSSVSSTPVASHGIGEPLITETNQFYRDEKYVLTSYNTSLRHAHYLLSGLLKKMSTKIESDLRPLLETITSDLLEVVMNAPVEWPAACTLLSVLGGLLIQQLSQANPSTTTNSSSATSTSARTADLSSKLLSLDTLATLAIGIKKIDQKLGSSHLAGYKLVADKHSLANEKQVTLDDTSQNSTTAAKLRAKELLAKVRLLAFLSSPTSALHHWLVAPEYMYVNASQASVVGESTIDVNSAADGFRNQERQCLKLIRLEYSDCLVLAAHRFHLASWIHNCTRELGELVSSSNNTSKTNSDGGGSANILKPTTSKRARELEQLRHQLLSELALTHYSLPSSLPWLTCSKQNGTVGSSSLSSPVTCKFGGRTGTNSQANGRSNSANQLVGYGGSILANNLSCERFIRQAHSCHANKQNRIRIAAHAHWSAVLLLYLHPVVPGFQKLFTVVCRLAGEASVPVRTKALRCLSNIIEVDPDLLTATDSDSEMVDGGLPRSSLLRLVHARLLDHSTAVREAAVDLVSRLLSLRPHALSQYYPMLAERVLDKGVSVRKRTIRCFRELLLSGWEFGDQMKGHPKHRSQLLVEQTGVEMSIKLIRRLHDEESIQKLVEEFFQILWFSPIPDSTRHWSRLLDQRILNLSSVILMLRCSSFDFLESFIKQVLSAEGPIKKEQMNSACEQMVDRLMTLIKRLVASLMSSTPRDKNKKFLHKASSPLQVPTLLSLLASLHLLSRCMPNLIQRHCDFLLNLLHKAPLVVVSAAVGSSSANHPNPDLEPPTGLDPQCLFHLVSTIEMSLLANESQDSDYRHHSSINDHISKTKLYELQADLLHLIQRQGRLVVDSSLSCLATLSNQVLCDHTEVATCFSQFYGLLLNLSLDLRKALSTRITNSTRISSRTRPSVLRALYTVGLMCKHFPLDDLVGENKRVATSSSSLLDEVLDTLMLFAEYAAAPVASHSATETSLTPSKGQTQINDADLCRKAMMGLGFVVSRHDQLLCTKRLRTFFLRFFINAESPATSPSSVKPSPFHEIQCIILDNLTHYLIDSERQMIADSRSWSAKHKSESLKELADQRSGHGSAVAQEYLPIVLDYCILTPNLNVRTAALGLISVILRQGLVHPVQTLPSLICLQADPDPGNRSRASHLLGEIDKKFSGFIAMRATSGLQMAYELHLLLQSPSLEFDQNPHSPLPLIRGATQDSCFSPQNSTIAGSTIASHPVALNHAVYALLRSNRQSRRSFINNLLSLFDTEQGRSLSSTTASPSSENSRSKRLQSLVTKCPLGRLVFITDQLAHFPYVLQDEIFYVSYYAEQRASVSGSSLLRLTQRTFLSSLLSGHCSPHKTDPSGCARKDISGDRTNTAELESYLLNLMETAESKLINRRSKHESTDDVGSQSESASDRLGLNELQHLLEQSQPPSLREKLRLALVSTGPACLLLLTLRHHMREFYGVSDGKLKDYSPSDCPKQWDKPIVQPKRPNPSDPMLRLPSLVLHCLKHPEWQDATKTPSNTFVLTQLIRLRHQLLALEENGQCTDFPSQELNEQQQKQECNSSVINPQSSTFSSPADKIMDSSFERGQNLSTKFQTKNSEKRTSKHGSSSIEGSPAANSSTSAKNPDDLKSVVVEHEHQCSPPNKSNPKLKFPTSSGKSQAEFPLSSSSAHKRRAPPTPSISSSSLSSSSPSSTTSSDSGSSSEAEGLRRAQKLHTSNASRVTKAKPSAGGTGSVQKMVSEGHANRTPLHKVKSHGNDLTQKAKHAHHPKENEAARVSKRAYSSSGLDSDDSDSVVTSAVHTERKATNTQQSQLHSRREFPGVRSSSHIPHKEVRKHGDTHVRRDTSQLSTTSSAHKADRSDRRNKPKKHVMAAGSASATTHPHASDSTTHKSKKSPVVSSAATSRDSERSAMHSLHKAAETTRHSDGSGIRKPTKTKINGNQPVGVGRSLAPLPQAMMKSNVPHRPSHKRPSAQMAQNIKKYPKEKSSSPSADYPRHHRSHQTKDSKSLPSYNNAVASTSNCDTMQPKPRPHPPKASNNNASSANSMGSGSSDIASQRARNSSSKPAKSVSPRHTQRVRRLSESSSLSPDTDDEDKCSFTSSTSVSSVSTPSDSSLSSSSSSDPPPAKLKHKSSVR